LVGVRIGFRTKKLAVRQLPERDWLNNTNPHSSFFSFSLSRGRVLGVRVAEKCRRTFE
jgi:hypothetical protein